MTLTSGPPYKLFDGLDKFLRAEVDHLGTLLVGLRRSVRMSHFSLLTGAHEQLREMAAWQAPAFAEIEGKARNLAREKELIETQAAVNAPN